MAFLLFPLEYKISYCYPMGVFKLWELLLTIAQPSSLQKLSGKILAIDASIWIVRIDTSLTTNTEKIKSILNKIMLLKRHNILPIFVFDGLPPALKRKTLEERSRRRIVANDVEAKKKSEIQIMRIIQGEPSSRNSEKVRRIQANQSELEVINEQLKKLSDLPKDYQMEISKELLEKITLQSQILDTKYKIMVDLLPEYQTYPYYIEHEQFKGLDLDLKLQYLDELEEFKWKSLKKERKTQKKEEQLSQEEKLMKDLEVIEKKSVVRELQDNLFRKMMQKHVKVQNGFEVIETIYNGRKVTQKRKVKTKEDSKYGFGPLRKDKMKNDTSKISFASEKDSDASADEDPFIKSFCHNKNVEIQQKKEQLKQVKEEKPEQSSFVPQLKIKKKKNKNKGQTDSNHEESQPYIPFKNYAQRSEELPQTFVNAEQFHQKIQQSQSFSLNRDNLPNFTASTFSNYLNASNDNVELQNLFTILGLPFLVAPGEAEAQCAALQQEGIVDGTITQDSDTFLFGGKNVYRGVFSNNVRHYSFEKMQSKLRLTRQKLIIFAELLGSDYTEGIKGIGLVNAMEILKVFNTFQKLSKFKKWAEHPDVLLPEEETTSELLKNANAEQRQFYQLHRKFKNYWYITSSFGNEAIHKAYLHPQVLKRESLRSMKESKFFGQQEIKQSLLQKLLKERLQMSDVKQYEHYFKLLTLKYENRRDNTLLNYFSRKEEEVEMAKIRSKRLQKSLQNLEQDGQNEER